MESAQIIHVDGPTQGCVFTVEHMKRLVVTGSGSPVWDHLAASLQINTTDPEAWWAVILTALGPTGILGSRWVMRGQININLEVRKLFNIGDPARKAKFDLTIPLEDFTFPETGDIRNVSLWRNVVDDQGFSATSSSAEEIRAMKDTGLLARLVVIPAAADSARVFIQLLPVTVDKLKERLLDPAGNPTMSHEDIVIPAMMFPADMMGCKEKYAFMTPQPSSQLGEGCGFGCLPLLLVQGAAELPSDCFPSLNQLKAETFGFLRKSWMPPVLKSKTAWTKVYNEGQFDNASIPEVIWPEVPAVAAQPSAEQHVDLEEDLQDHVEYEDEEEDEETWDTGLAEAAKQQAAVAKAAPPPATSTRAASKRTESRPLPPAKKSRTVDSGVGGLPAAGTSQGEAGSPDIAVPGTSSGLTSLSSLGLGPEVIAAIVKTAANDAKKDNLLIKYLEQQVGKKKESNIEDDDVLEDDILTDEMYHLRDNGADVVDMRIRHLLRTPNRPVSEWWKGKETPLRKSVPTRGSNLYLESTMGESRLHHLVCAQLHDRQAILNVKSMMSKNAHLGGETKLAFLKTTSTGSGASLGVGREWLKPSSAWDVIGACLNYCSGVFMTRNYSHEGIALMQALHECRYYFNVCSNPENQLKLLERAVDVAFGKNRALGAEGKPPLTKEEYVKSLRATAYEHPQWCNTGMLDFCLKAGDPYSGQRSQEAISLMNQMGARGGGQLGTVQLGAGGGRGAGVAKGRGAQGQKGARGRGGLARGPQYNGGGGRGGQPNYNQAMVGGSSNNFNPAIQEKLAKTCEAFNSSSGCTDNSCNKKHLCSAEKPFRRANGSMGLGLCWQTHSKLQH